MKEIKLDEPKPKKWKVEERREHLLKRILEAGRPNFITQDQLAKEYGVSQVQIHKDMNAIAEKVKANLGDKAELRMESAYNHIINELIKSPDPKSKYMAAKVIKDWGDWLFSIGAREKAADKHVIEGSGIISHELVQEAYERAVKGKKKKR